MGSPGGDESPGSWGTREGRKNTIGEASTSQGMEKETRRKERGIHETAGLLETPPGAKRI